MTSELEKLFKEELINVEEKFRSASKNFMVAATKFYAAEILLELIKEGKKTTSYDVNKKFTNRVSMVLAYMQKGMEAIWKEDLTEQIVKDVAELMRT